MAVDVDFVAFREATNFDSSLMILENCRRKNVFAGIKKFGGIQHAATKCQNLIILKALLHLVCFYYILLSKIFLSKMFSHDDDVLRSVIRAEVHRLCQSREK